MQDYHNLLIWKRGMEFVHLVYKLTPHFPKAEQYGLTSQFRRAAISIVANIVEGRGKNTEKDFLRFLYIAHGSLNECGCYIEIARMLEFFTDEQMIVLKNKRDEIGFLLNKFVKSLENNLTPPKASQALPASQALQAFHTNH